MAIFKKTLAFFGFVALTALSLSAEIHETPRRFKEMVVNMEDVSSIEMILTVTERVDSCNHHGLVANIHDIGEQGESYYFVDLSISSTQMACMDPTMHDETFTHTFVIDGSYTRVLMPEHAQVTVKGRRSL